MPNGKVTVYLTEDKKNWLVDLGNGYASVHRATITSAMENPLSHGEKTVIALCERLAEFQAAEEAMAPHTGAVE